MQLVSRKRLEQKKAQAQKVLMESHSPTQKADAHVRLGECAVVLGDVNGAFTHYTEALLLDGSHHVATRSILHLRSRSSASAPCPSNSLIPKVLIRVLRRIYAKSRIGPLVNLA